MGRAGCAAGQHRAPDDQEPPPGGGPAPPIDSVKNIELMYVVNAGRPGTSTQTLNYCLPTASAVPVGSLGCGSVHRVRADHGRDARLSRTVRRGPRMTARTPDPKYVDRAIVGLVCSCRRGGPMRSPTAPCRPVAHGRPCSSTPHVVLDNYRTIFALPEFWRSHQQRDRLDPHGHDLDLVAVPPYVSAIPGSHREHGAGLPRRAHGARHRADRAHLPPLPERRPD